MASSLRLVLAAVAVASCSGKLAAPDDASTDASIPDASGDPPAIDPPLAPTDVLGELVGPWGERMPNAKVMVDGVPIPVDAWGRFVVRNAPSQYDAVAASHLVNGYFGLTTRHPIIEVYDPSALGPPHQATLQLSPSPDAMYFVQNTDGSLHSYVSSAYVALKGSTDTLPVYALGYQMSPEQVPTHFWGYASDTLAFQEGSTTSWTPTYTTITSEQTITGNVSVPTGWAVYEAYLKPSLGETTSAYPEWGHLRSGINGPPWTFVVPQIDGWTWHVMYQANTGAAGSYEWAESDQYVEIAADGSVPDVSIVAAPAPVSPPNFATFGAGTSFKWSGGRSVCTMTLDTFSFTTMNREMVFPDLSPIGIKIASGQKFAWNVTCRDPAGPPTNVDPLLAPLGIDRGATLADWVIAQ